MCTSAALSEKPISRKIRVLIAVEPLPLLRVMEHLLAGAPEIQIIACPHVVPSLVLQAKRLQPDLIIANARLLGEEARDVLTNLKRSCPRSKLILTDFAAGLAGLASQWGVDVYLEEEVLVEQLLLAARQLAPQRRPRVSLKKLKSRVTASRRARRSIPG